MAVSKQTRDAVKQLAATIAHGDEGSWEDLSLQQGFKQAAIPERLREAAGAEALTLSGTDLRLYQKALNKLASEPELEHLSTRDIDDELWEFVCDVFVQKTTYQNDAARMAGIRKLVEGLRRPWHDYEVIAFLENIKLTVRSMHVIGVEFAQLSHAKAEEWGITGLRQYRDHLASEIGKAAAFTKERAGTPRRAAERSIDVIDDALNGLRTGLAGPSESEASTSRCFSGEVSFWQ